MQTLVFDCEIDATRDVLLHLPPTVTPGRHRISLVIDPPEPMDTEVSISPIPENVPPRTALWSQLAALRSQAEKDGVLPQPLSWDGVIAEARQRQVNAIIHSTTTEENP